MTTDIKSEQRQGFYIRGTFDRISTETVQKKDGSTFEKHFLHLIVQGKNRTEVPAISIRHPQKYADLKRGQPVEVEFYSSTRVWEGRPYTTYYEAA